MFSVFTSFSCVVTTFAFQERRDLMEFVHENIEKTKSSNICILTNISQYCFKLTFFQMNNSRLFRLVSLLLWPCNVVGESEDGWIISHSLSFPQLWTHAFYQEILLYNVLGFLLRPYIFFNAFNLILIFWQF